MQCVRLGAPLRGTALAARRTTARVSAGCCRVSGVESDFMPWLMESVETQLSLATASRHLLDAVIKDVVSARASRYSQLEATERTAAQRRREQQRATYDDETMFHTTATDHQQQASSHSPPVIYQLHKLRCCS